MDLGIVDRTPLVRPRSDLGGCGLFYPGQSVAPRVPNWPAGGRSLVTARLGAGVITLSVMPSGSRRDTEQQILNFTAPEPNGQTAKNEADQE